MVGKHIITASNDTRQQFSLSIDALESNDSRNLITNGSFQVCQLPTPFDASNVLAPNNDGGHIMDRWYQLQDGNNKWNFDNNISRIGSLAASQAFRATKVATDTSRFAIVQGLDVQPSKLISLNGKVSLSFWARSSGVTNLRWALLHWDSGTYNNTHDLVAVWPGSSGVEPTWAVNYTRKVLGNLTPVTSSWQQFTFPNLTVNAPTTTNHYFLVIWADDYGIPASSTVDISEVCLTPTTLAAPYQYKEYQKELWESKRFLQVIRASGASNLLFHGLVDGNGVANIIYNYEREVVKVPPTITLYGGSLWSYIDYAASPITQSGTAPTITYTTKNLVKWTGPASLTGAYGVDVISSAINEGIIVDASF